VAKRSALSCSLTPACPAQIAGAVGLIAGIAQPHSRACDAIR
jgi:hypothetical protein